MVQGDPNQEIVVTPDNLTKFVGNPKFSKFRFYQQTPPVIS